MVVGDDVAAAIDDEPGAKSASFLPAILITVTTALASLSAKEFACGDSFPLTPWVRIEPAITPVDSVPRSTKVEVSRFALRRPIKVELRS